LPFAAEAVFDTVGTARRRYPVTRHANPQKRGVAGLALDRLPQRDIGSSPLSAGVEPGQLDGAIIIRSEAKLPAAPNPL
jgi:hypothetical protein